MTREELIIRLERPEWHDLECKKSQHGVSEDAYRTVSAFANTSGGVLVFGVPDEEFLFQLGLVRETPHGRKPTNAAILLFGSDGYLRGLLPRPIADCQRFDFPFGANPPGVRWTDRVVMESNIVQTWLAFLNWYMKFSSVPFRLDPMTMERDDTPPDFVAFRESFVNVLCHQDYQDHTRKPEIRHFTDRTIFWNPGDAFAVGDLLEPGPKEVRNPNIAIAFRRVGFSENAGWGLNDVIANWTKLGHARPGIDNSKAGKYFEVTLLDIAAQVEAQVEIDILRACLDTPLSSAEIAKALGHKKLSGNVRKALPRMREALLLEYTIPDKPNSRMQKYQVTETGRKVLN